MEMRISFSHSLLLNRGASQVLHCTLGPHSGHYAFRIGSLPSSSLPHHGYICGSVGPAGSVSGSWLVLSSCTSFGLLWQKSLTRLSDKRQTQIVFKRFHFLQERSDSHISFKKNGRVKDRNKFLSVALIPLIFKVETLFSPIFGAQEESCHLSHCRLNSNTVLEETICLFKEYIG